MYVGRFATDFRPYSPWRRAPTGLQASFGAAHLCGDPVGQQRGAALAAVRDQEAAQAQVVHIVIRMLQVEVLKEAGRQLQPAPEAHAW